MTYPVSDGRFLIRRSFAFISCVPRQSSFLPRSRRTVHTEAFLHPTDPMPYAFRSCPAETATGRPRRTRYVSESGNKLQQRVFPGVTRKKASFPRRNHLPALARATLERVSRRLSSTVSPSQPLILFERKSMHHSGTGRRRISAGSIAASSSDSFSM